MRINSLVVLTDDYIGQISFHHHNASLNAAKAIYHAREAGRLLIAVKSKLAHGEFVSWMSANVSISSRQAQRYMKTAKGSEHDEIDVKTVSSKNDSMSHLPKKKARNNKTPEWSPNIKFIYFAVWDEWSYILHPNQSSNEFHITVMFSVRTSLDDSYERLQKDSDFKKFTVPLDQVALTLKTIGIAEPGKLWWTLLKPDDYGDQFSNF